MSQHIMDGFTVHFTQWVKFLLFHPYALSFLHTFVDFDTWSQACCYINMISCVGYYQYHVALKLPTGGENSSSVIFSIILAVKHDTHSLF